MRVPEDDPRVKPRSGGSAVTAVARAESSRLTVLRPVGAGGMAELFLAERRGAEGACRRVVLKRILPAYAREPDFRALFVHEARVAMQLSHANIVQVYDFAESGDTYVIEMEYVEGCDLRRLLRTGPLPLAAALHISTEILRGLDYAHRRLGADGAPLQIVHRDVSPGNILLSHEGEVKLADFGLARSRERVGKSVGGVKGTFAFMAPEQAEGRAVDARSDVFAVGAILYTTLVGRSPFEAAGPVATLDAVREARYVPLTEAAPGAPPALEPILALALARAPEDRYPSAGAMREALEAFAHEAGLRLLREATGALVRGVAPDEPPPLPAPSLAPATRTFVSPPGPPPAAPESAGSSGGAPALEPAAPHTLPLQLPLREARRPSSLRPILWAGLLVLAGTTTVAVLLRSSGRSGPIAVVVSPEAPPSAPPVTAPASALAPVSGAADVPAPTASPAAAAAATPAAPRPRPRATLTVSADPWAYVSIDGRRLGTTPLQDLSLSAGPHEVTFENPPLGVVRNRLVRLRPGQHRTLIEKLSRDAR